MTGVFTIPADLCFVSTLAKGLWARAKKDPFALSSYTIYLPTRRACRALRDAFLRVGDAQAALLPRLMPLGEIDETDEDFAEEGGFDECPPALSPLRRHMLLTRAVLKKDETLPLDQAASMAEALAGLMDQAENEGLDFAALNDLVPEDYAEHWQETLLFLEIVTKEWPRILAEEGAMDPVARRNALLDSHRQRWLSAPPLAPVIAAGSTGSVPAVGRLMASIASLPQGEVILPGLDLALEEEAWQAIEETHPQFTMKSWLASAGIPRGDVRVWENGKAENPARVALLREALRPPESTQVWRGLTEKEIPARAYDGIDVLSLDTQREEADVIALRLRAALEDEGKTAALVTPDRALAARVSAAMRRWGIDLDDSAGSPLPFWPVGSFLLHVLDAASPGASPVSLLALLKHPLTAAGGSAQACRSFARAAEVAVWRGVRRAGGFAGAAEAVRTKKEPLGAFLTDVAAMFLPASQSWREQKKLEEWIDLHMALAEKLAATEAEAGALRLWRGPDGEAAASWLADWRTAAAGFPLLSGHDYANLFGSLSQTVPVRAVYGSHPRLSLLGPLEARLLHHDLIILGGMNEGVWPPAPAPDPWMSRPMKKEFGLPSPERRVGLSAHDFAQTCCARSVFITRAQRVMNAPAVPSRFVLQLETVLRAVGAAEALAPAVPWRDYARVLDAPAAVCSAAPPEPRPPLSARPRTLPVTDIGTWLRNPYAIYARRILNLRRLDPIDADASAAEQGSAIHEALEKFLSQTLEKWPARPLDLLLEEGRKAFAAYADRPQVKALWWPRFERIAEWFVAEEEKRRARGVVPLALEAEGACRLPSGFTLTGRADRIDKLPEGLVEIIDYKTGGVPSAKKMEAGLEPQLPLLALIASEGGFASLGPRDAGQVSYWALRGREIGAEIKAYKGSVEEQKERARNGLENLVRVYADPRTPYLAVPRPAYVPDYNDYEHLARVKEWGRERGGRK